MKRYENEGRRKYGTAVIVFSDGLETRTLLSFDLWRSYWSRSAALFEENSTSLLPESLESLPNGSV